MTVTLEFGRTVKNGVKNSVKNPVKRNVKNGVKNSVKNGVRWRGTATPRHFLDREP